MDRVKKNFGFGCMRLPMIGEDVDLAQFQEMVDEFMDAGFNYFDTAHGYLEEKAKQRFVNAWQRDIRVKAIF